MSIYFSSSPHAANLGGHPALRGDGIFETLRVESGTPQFLNRHLARMSESSRRLKFESAPIDLIEGQARVLATEWQAKSGRMRITLFVDGNFHIGLEEFDSQKKFPLKVGISQYPIASTGALSGSKSISYGANTFQMRLAQESGLSDLIVLNERGEVVETLIANLFIIAKGRVVTPSLQSGALPGIARAILLESADVLEEEISASELLSADGVFLSSSLRGLRQIETLVGEGRVKNFAPLEIFANLESEFEATRQRESRS